MDYFEEIVRQIVAGKISSGEELQKAKMELCKKYNIAELPSNSQILEGVERIAGVSRGDVIDVLQRKPMRTKSGVAVVAVMTSPAECPHGRCKMCPGGPRGEHPSPQSYTGKEPAALRAERNDYDPERQVKDRLKQYRAIGHPTDKIDMIIMGGTFPSRDRSYQEAFVKGCFDGLNGRKSASLREAHRINEKADNRCIGMTVETRPDYCKERELKDMLSFGATRVEIGAQTLSDKALKSIDRGHDVQDTVDATSLAKERGLKVCYHMMPGLPGNTKQDDLRDFKRLFEEERFRPDQLKIYPALVIKGTKLFDMWKSGEYRALKTDEAADLIAEMKALVPRYVRIQRVQRDIPSPLVDAGVKKSNLRQYARKKLEERGEECDCIRCREAGHSDRELDTEKIDLHKTTYKASGGKEYFLEYGDGDVVIAYARLRIGNTPPTIRELKVVGEMTPISEEGNNYQHLGYGKSLVSECEKIAGENGNKIRITSGVGARGYYRKLGYLLVKPYMVKDLRT